MKLEKLDKNHAYFTSNMAELVEDSYYERRGDFHEFLHQLSIEEKSKPPQRPSTLPAQSQIDLTTHSFSHALPRIDLPKFTGKYDEWENFRDIFRALVQRREDMSASIKFYYLKTHLVGEVLDKIKGLAMSDANFEGAWAALTAYYENKRRLVTASFTEFFSVTPMKSESSSELKRLVKETFNPLNGLDSLDRAELKFEDLVVFLTASRFDPSTREGLGAVPWKLCEAPHFEAVKRIYTSAHSNLRIDGRRCKIKLKPGKAKEKSVSVHTTQTSNKNQARKPKVQHCAICKQEHFTSACQTLHSKTASEHKALVLSKNLCSNCLGMHPLSECRSSKLCSTCSKNHHSLLHEAYSLNPAQSSTKFNSNCTLKVM